MGAAYLKMMGCGKVEYLTEQMVFNAIRNLSEEFWKRDSKRAIPMLPYLCKKCGYWHMGHDTRALPNERTANQCL